jgi:acyl-CoA thioesterase FadM
MARVKLELPPSFVFATELRVRVGDVNHGGHLGNDRLLSLLQEARVRFLAQHGCTELDLFGSALIQTDAVIVYRSEAFCGETLRIELAGEDFNKYGCDLLYRVTEKESGHEVARAKTGMVCFDYAARRLQRAPAAFFALFNERPERPVPH